MVALRLSLLSVALLAFGCGQGTSGPPSFPVEGTVELNNRPLDKGEIVFFSNDGKTTVNVPIDAGKFSGKVPAGNYTVRFSSTKEMPNPKHDPNSPGSTPTHVVNIIPAKYAAESTEKANITEAGPNKFAYSLR